LSDRDGVAYDGGRRGAPSTTWKESPMRIVTMFTALLTLLALMLPVRAYAGGAFALPPVACTIIIVILVIVIIYLWFTRRR
jgi:protein-S-isoprenylcysteine O-methyltransferase Ste14